ncbi:hypothetical protein LINPERPRIM_LOCUS13465 [Linum perenne]
MRWTLGPCFQRRRIQEPYRRTPLR